MKNNFFIAGGVLVVIVIGSVFASLHSTQKAPKVAITAQGSITETISISGQQKKSIITLASGETALDALKKKYTVESKGIGKDAFVTSIDGRKADDSKHEFWAFYVNGKQAEVGAGSYELQNNDTIEWKLETY